MDDSFHKNQRRFYLDALALALTPWTILLQGHQFGLGNHYLTLISMRRLLDQGYLAGDWLLSTPAHHPLWTGVLAHLSTLTGESGALLVAHIITRIVLLMGVWRLVAALMPKSGLLAGGIGMALTLFEPRLQAGSHYLQGGHWEAGFLGMALAVWILAEGIHFWSEGKHLGALVIAGGLGVLSHLFINLPLLVIVCLGAMAFRREWKGPLAVLGGALFISLPVWGPAAAAFLMPLEAPLSSREIIQVLQFRHPHHHQPWTWPIFDLAAAAILIGAGGAALWRVCRTEGEARRLLLPTVFFGYFLISCATFWIFGRLQLMPVVAYFQPFRLLSLFFALTMAAAGIVAEGAMVRYPRSIVLAVIFASAAVVRFGGGIGPFLAAPVLVFFAFENTRKGSAEPPPAIPSNLVLPVSVAAMTAGFVIMMLLQFVPALRKPLLEIRRTHWLTKAEPVDPARAGLAEWVRENTRPGALFVVPPGTGYFRLWEERPIVVDYKAVPYENVHLDEWADRIQRVGGGNPFDPFAVPPETDPSPEVLLEAARYYGADYVVLRNSHYRENTVFRNDKYSVIRVW